MYVVVVTPPEPLVSLELAKKHLRRDDDDHDDLIETLIEAASAAIDGPQGWLSRCVGQQLLELRSNRLVEEMLLPYGPATEIESFKYAGVGGVQIDLSEDDYVLMNPYVTPPYGAAWPPVRDERNAKVIIRYRAGYEAVPKPIVTAALLIIGELYANPAAAGAKIQLDEDSAAGALLAPYRCWWP